jgi:transposase-like protein
MIGINPAAAHNGTVRGVPPTFRTADPLGFSTGKDGIMAGKSKYKTYSPEFKEEAARLVVDTSRPIADVARELGISETSLGNWVRAWREKHAEEEPPLQVSERARLRELERLNRELEMELAFLKKAAAYFAREHR